MAPEADLMPPDSGLYFPPEILETVGRDLVAVWLTAMQDAARSRMVLRVWLGADEKPAQGSDAPESSVAWIAVLDGHVLSDYVTPAGLPTKGSTLHGLLRAATDICERYRGIEIVVTSDHAPFWKALHPDYRWLEEWRADGFTTVPDGLRDAWQGLQRAIQCRGIKLTAGPPGEGDEESVQRLKACTARAASYSVPGGDERWWEG
jgi:hypothetical protein